MTVSPAQRDFRDAMSVLASGVTVVTTTTRDGHAGMTASAVCSLSLEPMQLLVCISRNLPTHRALEESGNFAINVLGEEHAPLALRFATPAADRFSGLPLDERHGVPILRDAIATFVCSVRECIAGGDHSIFIGEILECGHVSDARPLLYFQRSFGALESADSLLLRTWVEGGVAV